MAAGVQHNDRAVGQGIEVFQQAAAVHVVGGGVVVAVVLHREAGGFEQGAVVFPAWVADGDDGVRQQLLEEVGTDLQCTGAPTAWVVMTRPEAISGESLPNSKVCTAWS